VVTFWHKYQYFFLSLHHVTEQYKTIIVMRKLILLAGLTFVVLTATAQENPYIVKTKGVKKVEVKAANQADNAQEEEPEATDFMGKNFRFYSMCDWKEGMRFMVIPEKYDLLVNTFCDAETKKEVSSGKLRHMIMVYKGHEDMPNGRVHINFTCENNQKKYYYELPNGTFDDYCYGKLGVPTLAYLGDVDKARELLLGQKLLTRTQLFRVDTEYDGDGYREVTVEKNKLVEVKAIGVGSRSFPVKIIVEDEDGEQFYQNVAMSKTNSGLRDDEFDVDNEKFLFEGSFEFSDDNMAVSNDVKSYLNQTVHTRIETGMSSKGAGKYRDITVPAFTGFVIDEIKPLKNSNLYSLTLRETESRRIYYKEVSFREEDASNENYFGHLFGKGDGEARSSSKETRMAIREGRVIPGMTKDEVEMAVGVAATKIKASDGTDMWLYARSNGVVLDVKFDSRGIVKSAKARRGDSSSKESKGKKSSSRKNVGGIQGGTMETGTPL